MEKNLYTEPQKIPRFTLRRPMTQLVKQFGIETDLQLKMRYNVAPSQSVPAVRLDDGKLQLALLRWGLIPSWAKDAKIGYSLINARADTVETKPSFRAAHKKRRCLVLADGYYEWEKAGKAKLPWLYEVDGGKPFAFACLWEFWKADDAEAIESCAIITTDANELAAEVHNRMPVILDEGDYDD